MAARQLRIVLDTNIWISFLIGKELKSLKELLAHDRIRVIISHSLVSELKTVLSRDRLKNFFPEHGVSELIQLIDLIAEYVPDQPIERICRDPKDDFILSVAKAGNATHLITGDHDLLTLGSYSGTSIVSPSEFKLTLHELYG
jgi:hypothetical protein